jgi:hypothetical protein
MTDVLPTPALTEVFDALQEAARSSAAVGRVLHGPQAKRTLTTLYPNFNLRNYGYRKFVELLRAGHDAGRFELVTVEGHPHIVPTSAVPVTRQVEQGRLRPDLWTTLVSWDNGIRYWDRRNRRAIFVPTDDHGALAWNAAPERYVEIDGIPMQQQLEWMVDFANDQRESSQALLLESLRGAPHGEFKRSLNELGLTNAWRTRLRQRVTEHAYDWAARAKLPPTSILDMAPRPTTHAPAQGSESASAVDDTEAARLRARLLQIIGQMSLSELAQLQIPASYLLEP